MYSGAPLDLFLLFQCDGCGQGFHVEAANEANRRRGICVTHGCGLEGTGKTYNNQGRELEADFGQTPYAKLQVYLKRGLCNG